MNTVNTWYRDAFWFAAGVSSATIFVFVLSVILVAVTPDAFR